jgi:hypothetical protein
MAKNTPTSEQTTQRTLSGSEGKLGHLWLRHLDEINGLLMAAIDRHPRGHIWNDADHCVTGCIAQMPNSLWSQVNFSIANGPAYALAELRGERDQQLIMPNEEWKLLRQQMAAFHEKLEKLGLTDLQIYGDKERYEGLVWEHLDLCGQENALSASFRIGISNELTRMPISQAIPTLKAVANCGKLHGFDDLCTLVATRIAIYDRQRLLDALEADIRNSIRSQGLVVTAEGKVVDRGRPKPAEDTQQSGIAKHEFAKESFQGHTPWVEPEKEGLSLKAERSRTNEVGSALVDIIQHADLSSSTLQAIRDAVASRLPPQDQDAEPVLSEWRRRYESERRALMKEIVFQANEPSMKLFRDYLRSLALRDGGDWTADARVDAVEVANYWKKHLKIEFLHDRKPCTLKTKDRGRGGFQLRTSGSKQVPFYTGPCFPRLQIRAAPSDSR